MISFRRMVMSVAFAACGLSQAAEAQLHPSFGVDGKVILHLDDITRAADVVSDAQDTLFALAWCGHSDSLRFDADCAVAKLDPNGDWVASFGAGGISRFDFAGMEYSTARCMVRMDDGRLLVLGSGSTFAKPEVSPLCVARLLPDGSPDLSFGTSGTTVIQFYGGQEFAGDLQMRTSHVWLAGGSWDTLGLHNVPVIGSYEEGLSPDSGFGGTGELVIDFTAGLTSPRRTGGSDAHRTQHLTGGEAYAALPLADGSVLVGGSYGAEAFLTRITSSGQLDSTFGSSGHLLFQPEAFYNNWVQKLVQLPDGSLLVAVNSDRTAGRNFHLLCLAEGDGSLLDYAEADVADGNDELVDLAVTPTGEVLCLASTKGALTANLRQMAVVLLPDPADLSRQQSTLLPVDSSFACAPAALAMRASQGAVVAGSLNNLTGGSDLVLVALDSTSLTIHRTDPRSDGSLIVWPNPCAGSKLMVGLPKMEVEGWVELCDLQGQVLDSRATAGLTEMEWPLEGRARGTYLLILRSAEGQWLASTLWVRQ